MWSVQMWGKQMESAGCGLFRSCGLFPGELRSSSGGQCPGHLHPCHLSLDHPPSGSKAQPTLLGECLKNALPGREGPGCGLEILATLGSLPPAGEPAAGQPCLQSVLFLLLLPASPDYGEQAKGLSVAALKE